MQGAKLALISIAVLCGCLLVCGKHHHHRTVKHSLPVNAETINGWRRTGALVDPTRVVGITIYLTQRNVEELKRVAARVSTPSHPDYGNHLTTEQVGELIGDADAMDSTVAWLRHAGVSAHAIHPFRTNDALRVDMPLKLASELFQVQFEQFVHVNNANTIIHRTLEAPQVPADLPIELLSGVMDFPPVKRRQVKVASPTRAPEAKRASEEKSKVAGEPGAIQFVAVLGRYSGALQVMYIPTCLNGAVPNNTVNPCLKEAGQTLMGINAVLDYQVNVGGRSFGTPLGNQSFPISCTCTNTPNATVCAGDILCTFTWDAMTAPALPNYVPFTLSATLDFGPNTTAGNFYENDWPVLTTPGYTLRTVAGFHNIPWGMRVQNTSSTQAVAEFEQQYMSVSDLQQFMVEMGLENDFIHNITFIGPNNSSNPGGEASLDIQWLMGLAPGAPTTFWSIAANSTVEIDDILTWGYQVGNATNPPLVHTLSYGMAEGNVDKYLGNGYLLRSDAQFAVLASMGLTVIFATGDTGAYLLGGEPMGTSNCDAAHPDWPGQSPYITAVGSTMLTPFSDPLCYGPQGVDCSGDALGHVALGMQQGLFWTTGSGVSNVAPRMWYQQAAAEKYLSLNIPFPQNFNRTGRMYPDLVTIGHGLSTVIGGVTQPIDGTSASAPIWAAMVTLINDQRLQAGKKPVGWFNPALYQIAEQTPEAFFDVTVGENACGAYGAPPVCCAEQRGFQAAPGFDAISGLGAPNFRALLAAVLALP